MLIFSVRVITYPYPNFNGGLTQLLYVDVIT